MFCSLRPSFILKHFLAYSIIYYFGFDKSCSIFVSFIPNEFISGFFFYFMFIFITILIKPFWRIWMFIRSLVYGNMLCKSSLTVSIKKLVTVSICVSMLVFWSVSKFSWCSLDKCCLKSSLFFKVSNFCIVLISFLLVKDNLLHLDHVGNRMCNCLLSLEKGYYLQYDVQI